MELYDQIRRISFIFFTAVGLAHFTAGLLFINGYFAPTASLVNRVLYIPFVLSTLTYALSNLKCRLLEYGKDSKTWNYMFLAAGIIVFASLLAVELLVVDSPSPIGIPKTL